MISEPEELKSKVNTITIGIVIQLEKIAKNK